MKQQLYLYWKISESRLRTPNCGFFQNTDSLQCRVPDFCKQSLISVSVSGEEGLVKEAYKQTVKKLESLPQKDGNNPGLNQPCLLTSAHTGMYYLQLEMGDV